MYDKGRTYYWKHILFPVIPDMPEEMAHFHGPTVTCPQT